MLSGQKSNLIVLSINILRYLILLMSKKTNFDRILNDPFLGVILGAISCKGYRILNLSPQYIHNYRVHHYQVGLGLLLWGIIQNKQFWIAFGSILLIDDIDDLINDLNNENRY